jgi:hypothetical protein
MDQPENQQRMADSRQQLEQTREDVRKAAQSLEQGQIPQASAAGARAGEQLNNLRDEVRRRAAGQFGDAMNQMRPDARELDQNQEQLSQRLSPMDATGRPRESPPRPLREPGGADERQQIG